MSRGAAGTTKANIANNAFLVKIGNVHSEGQRAPAAASRNPVKYKNYTQIFKNTYEITGTAEQTNTRTGDPIKNDKRRKMFDHSRDMEMSILFGHAHEDTSGEGGKPRRFSGGFREFIPNKVLGASWSLTSLIDLVSPVFDWDTEAGDERMVFAGNGALNKWNQKIEAQSNSTQINFMGDKEMYGVRFMKYRVPQGSFYVKTHPLLSRHPIYTNSWFILDASQYKMCPLRGRDTKFKDNAQHNDEDSRKGYWQTEAGLMVDGGGQTMMYVGGFGK